MGAYTQMNIMDPIWAIYEINPYAILGDTSLTKPPFGVTSAEVVINWEDPMYGAYVPTFGIIFMEKEVGKYTVRPMERFMGWVLRNTRTLSL